jgi:hypothetical protein
MNYEKVTDGISDTEWLSQRRLRELYDLKQKLIDFPKSGEDMVMYAEEAIKAIDGMIRIERDET